MSGLGHLQTFPALPEMSLVGGKRKSISGGGRSAFSQSRTLGFDRGPVSGHLGCPSARTSESS